MLAVLHFNLVQLPFTSTDTIQLLTVTSQTDRKSERRSGKTTAEDSLVAGEGSEGLPSCHRVGVFKSSPGHAFPGFTFFMPLPFHAACLPTG